MAPQPAVAVEVKGKKEKLDVVWRPVARIALTVLGLTGSIALWWTESWLWMPLPLAGSVLLFELVFWLRGDRPMVVRLDGTRLTATDRKGGSTLAVDLADATVASVAYREARDGQPGQAFFVFHDDERPLVALRLATPFAGWPPEATDLDALQPVLGGNAGVLRGLAPMDRVVRQVLQDDDGALASALIAAVPREAWEGVAVRVWRGEAPAVDFMGLHQGPPDGLLTLRGDRWSLRDRFTGAIREGLLDAGSGGRTTREVELLVLPGSPQIPSTTLPVLVWHLAPDLTLAVPSVLAGRHGEVVPLDESALHTHLAEAANLVWWLLDRQPAGALPDGILEALADSRLANEHPPPTLRRHLSSAPREA